MSAQEFVCENIEALLPHAGPMVLLDEVVGLGEGRIVCRATSHRSVDNPLRVGDVLPVASGVEYAAQAMALYSRLSMQSDLSGRPREGYVAVVSKLQARVDYLHDQTEDLRVSVGLIDDAGDSSLFEFSVEGGLQILLSGRLLVVLSQS